MDMLRRQRRDGTAGEHVVTESDGEAAPARCGGVVEEERRRRRRRRNPSLMRPNPPL